MAGRDRVTAWRPRLAGVAEVFHAQWDSHAYPSHTHDTWALLLVDDGLIGYGLDRHEHSAARTVVTLLPPHVPHDGRSVTAGGFRKRVIYLDQTLLEESLVGRAVDAPYVADRALQEEVSRLDRALVDDDLLEAESRLALVAERLRWHLRGRPVTATPPYGRGLARLVRDRLDADPVAPVGLTDLAAELGVSATHLVRCFGREFGIPPYRYVLGRRLDLARRRLLEGEPASSVAVATGFYDQAHLTRHFRRLLSTTPGRYQRSGSR